MICGHTICQYLQFWVSGFLSQVLESHQAGKLDTSGTAKDVIACFEKLGVSYDMNRVCFYLLCLKTLLNYSCYERKAVCALENTSMLLKLPQCFHGSRSLPSNFFLLFSCTLNYSFSICRYWNTSSDRKYKHLGWSWVKLFKLWPSNLKFCINWQNKIDITSFTMKILS